MSFRVSSGPLAWLVGFLAVLAALTAASGLALSQPAAAHHDPAVTQEVVAFDTAWELGARATRAETIIYLDHLEQAGFTGFWFSYLSTTGLAFVMQNAQNNLAASFSDTADKWTLNQPYADDIEWMLDQANARGLKVGFVVAWGVRYVHGDWDEGVCSNENLGPLRASNSRDFGQQLAADFATHPAIAYWVMGGDNFCEKEDPQIWANLVQGLRDGGAKQQATFHSSPLGGRYTEFASESWMDFLAVETGHCMSSVRLEETLSDIINDPAKSFGKPVFAAEMRYEGFEPEWEGCAEHGPGRPVNATHVDTDIRAALRTGVAGVLFGNHTRWLWEPGDPYMETLGSAGEQSFLNVVRPHLADPATPPTSSTSTTTAPTTTSSTTTSTTTTTLTPPSAVLCNGVEATIVGSDNDDVIVGTTGRDVIVGLDGDDVIDGRGGNDLICGNDGNDKVLGGSGADVLLGGKGRDILKGGGGKDILRGSVGRDKLFGLGGDDVLEAGGGRDRLEGGKGADTLLGGKGADKLNGGPGIDRCAGGSGNNTTKSCP